MLKAFVTMSSILLAPSVSPWHISKKSIGTKLDAMTYRRPVHFLALCEELQIKLSSHSLMQIFVQHPFPFESMLCLYFANSSGFSAIARQFQTQFCILIARGVQKGTDLRLSCGVVLLGSTVSLGCFNAIE